MKRVYFILLLIVLVACKKEAENTTTPSRDSTNLLSIPEGFPPIPFPEGNELTAERWQLGKLLFFDRRLSINNSISCGSCHHPFLAFADNVAFSSGVFNRPGTRNSPSLANVAYQPYLLREGGVPTLEMQVLVPIQEHNEFNHNIVDIANELKSDTVYAEMSRKAYNREVDPFVITRAISNFQRTIISGNSRYDQFHFQNNSAALNSQEKVGMSLFFSSKTNCSNCHGGFNFSNYQFENNGLDSVYTDIGRQRFTNDSADEALFKVPSLRNVGLTAPYMHNGSIKTLNEVIEHYNSGGKNHKHKSPLLQPLHLSPTEKDALVAFLNALSDFEFINDTKWKN